MCNKMTQYAILRSVAYKHKKNIISDFYGKAKSATKTSTVTNIKYGDIEYYMNPIFDICQINNIDTLGYNIYQPTRHNLLHYNIYNKGNEYTWHSDGTVWIQNFAQKYTDRKRTEISVKKNYRLKQK